MSALVLGASMLLVSAATGCAAGYQPYATTTLATPVVQAEVSAPVIDAQVQIAPQPTVVVQPDLLSLTPDVQVVAAYDEPVFYTGGFYWREQNGGWYRSHSHDTGWSAYSDVPYSVRSIENRGSYRNYRPSGYQPRASYVDNRRPSYDRGGYQPRPSGGYDRPSGGYNQPTGYNRPAQRPTYGGNNYGNGYQPRTQGNDNRYNPRPSSGYNQDTSYSNPRPSSGYNNNQPRPSSGYNNTGSQGYQPRPSSSGYNNQPRPSSGYNNTGSQGYQPRPSGYSNGRAPAYQPRPSQSSYSNGRAPGYQPRPSQSSYNRPASSGSSYKRQPTSSSSSSRRRR